MALEFTSISQQSIWTTTGNTVQISCTVIGNTTPLLYRLYLNNVLLVESYSNLYVYTAAEIDSGKSFRWEAIDGTDSLMSNPIPLTVSPKLSIKSINTEEITEYADKTIIMNCEVINGVPPYSYTLIDNNLQEFADENNFPYYTDFNDNNKTLQWKIQDSAGSTTFSRLIPLNIILPVEISDYNPKDLIITSSGFPINFSCSATGGFGGTGNLTYKCIKVSNGAVIGTGQNFSYIFDIEEDGEILRWVVSDGTIETTSPDIIVDIYEPLKLESINKITVEVPENSSEVFSCVVSGGKEDSYVLELIDSDSLEVIGTGNSITTVLEYADNGKKFQWRVTDGISTIFSKLIDIVVWQGVDITLNQNSVNAIRNTSITLTATAQYGASYDYVWVLRDLSSNKILSNTNTYTFFARIEDNDKTYRWEVDDGYDLTLSVDIPITVYDPIVVPCKKNIVYTIIGHDINGDAIWSEEPWTPPCEVDSDAAEDWFN